MKKLLASMGFAFAGIRSLFAHERNAQLHLVSAVVTICVAFYLNVSNLEWIAILVCISTVIAAEAFNTAIEKLCDLVQPNHDPHIKIIKDLSAAAVLIISIAALCIGALIFVPKIINQFAIS
jgi:diacylglycerol kinase (ATP)